MAGDDLTTTGSGNVRVTQLTGAGGAVLGTLVAHLMPAPFAVMQILELSVVADVRRKGHGTRVLAAALADAKRGLGAAKLRRVYMSLPHKSAVDIRAFLTHQGFHHVTTMTGIIRGEDLLTYVKSYT